MPEQLFTIPVNEAFENSCECPLCLLYKQLEKNAIEYTLGPSYMEEDSRAITDTMGFCQKHIDILYKSKNSLGLALILKTHTDKTIKELEELSKKYPVTKSTVFKKSTSPIVEYIDKIEKSCFVCSKIEKTFDRYFDTIFYLWKKEETFRENFISSKGFCTNHYGKLYEIAQTKLSKNSLEDFIEALNKVYFDNIKRVNGDLGWFIDKFDYRYKNESWKNSKDALPRTIIKTNSTILSD